MSPTLSPRARIAGLLLTLWAWACPPAFADAPLVDTVAATLARPAVLRGRFEQDKQVVGFKKPLRSSGDFLLAGDRGVVWTTRQPFASELRLTRDSVSSRQDGQVVFSLDAGREPGVRAVNQLLFALLTGDIRALAAQFKVDGDARQGHWSLRLTPLDPTLAKVLARIDLSGDDLVRQVELDEGNGDHTFIRFSDLRPATDALTPAEAALFDAR